MEHSKPIVATLSGGPAEIITDGENGLLADIESSQSLYNKLEKIIIDPRMARKLSSAAYSQLKEKYDINIVSRKLSTILEDIIKQ
jgi:glycosyltransferase involved in cell wall biosynthesis